MTDDTRPAPFAAEGFPTFPEESQQAASEAAPSPQRKSRRSRRTAAAPTRPSPAKVTKPAAVPRRKYTRRTLTVTATGQTAAVPTPKPIDLAFASELEIVTEVVTKLRTLDAKARARVTNAIGKLL